MKRVDELAYRNSDLSDILREIGSRSKIPEERKADILIRRARSLRITERERRGGQKYFERFHIFPTRYRDSRNRGDHKYITSRSSQSSRIDIAV
jgi:hypothetical protein